MCIRNLFKRKKKEENRPQQQTHVYSNITTQEQFDNLLMKFYKQECALDDDSTYFEPQDNFFGEMFDNAIRIKLLIAEHPDFYANVNEEEFRAKAKEEYLKDRAEVDDEKEDAE